MFNKVYYSYDTPFDIAYLMKTSSLTKGVYDIPGADEWVFNTKKEIHINSTSTTKSGLLRQTFNNLKSGDIVEVQCEFYSLSGVAPKIAMDADAAFGVLSTEGYTYPTNQWKTIKVKHVVAADTVTFNTSIGVFTLDVGEFLVRNIRIALKTSDSDKRQLITGILPLNSGFQDNTEGFTSTITKSQGMVRINVDVKKTDGSLFLKNSTNDIARIPKELRGKDAFIVSLQGNPNVENGTGRAWVTEFGQIIVRPYVDLKTVSVNFTYFI